jgi:hypothetical protein
MASHTKLSVNITNEHAAYLRELAETHGSITQSFHEVIALHRHITDEIADGSKLYLRNGAWEWRVRLEGHDDKRTVARNRLGKLKRYLGIAD